jgi:DNA-binding response OmpR family regulator
MEDRGSTRTGLLLSDDLLFASRITGVARSEGVAIKVARSSEVMKKLGETERPSLVIVDLANPGMVVEDLVDWVNTFAASERPPIIAYGSHVDTATLKGARAAGCDEVMPRSQFVERLPTLFRKD